MTTAGVWLANQASGFGLLGYPWEPNTIGWGAAIGVGAMAGTLATQWLLRRLEGMRPYIQAVLLFVSAFAVYEATVRPCRSSAAREHLRRHRRAGAHRERRSARGAVGAEPLLTAASSGYRRRVATTPARFA